MQRGKKDPAGLTGVEELIGRNELGDSVSGSVSFELSVSRIAHDRVASDGTCL